MCDGRRNCDEDRQNVEPCGHSCVRSSCRYEKPLSFGFYHETGQAACSVSAGIDVYSVRQHFHLLARGVPVNDDLAKVFFAGEEAFADPEQILRLLPFERDTRSDAGVAKEIIAHGQRVFQRR